MSSPLDSGTLPKCQVVTCVQSVEKMLAIVLKLEMNGLCSSMERADWIYIKIWLFDVVRINKHGFLVHQSLVIEFYMRNILCHN